MLNYRSGLLLVTLVLCATAAVAADPPASIDDYVVVVDESLQIGDRSFVADGSVGVNAAGGDVQSAHEVFFAAPLAADRAKLGKGTSVFDLFTNELKNDLATIVVRGSGPLPFTPPIFAALPPLPIFSPGSVDVLVRQDQVLAPGAYRKIIVGKKRRLELTGGVYEIESLVVRQQSAVRVAAPSTINIADKFVVGSFGSFGPLSSLVAPADIDVNVGGKAVSFGSAAHVDADLLAPGAAIRFVRSFRGEGRFIGRLVVAGATVNLRRSRDCNGLCPAPPAQLCTFTQETYGTLASLVHGVGGVLATNPSVLPVTVGAPGILSVTVPDAARLACFLPTVGVPTSLCTRLGCTGDSLIDACASPPIRDFFPGGDGSSGGQGGGEIIGEIIAAKLNVALSGLGATPSGLGDLLLPRRLCTTKCPTGRFIDPTPMEGQLGAIGIADGLTTVNDLLVLADQAVSITRCRPGTCKLTAQTAILPGNPIRMSGLLSALNVVNECFDGCASLLPCPSE